MELNRQSKRGPPVVKNHFENVLQSQGVSFFGCNVSVSPVVSKPPGRRPQKGWNLTAVKLGKSRQVFIQDIDSTVSLSYPELMLEAKERPVVVLTPAVTIFESKGQLYRQVHMVPDPEYYKKPSEKRVALAKAHQTLRILASLIKAHGPAVLAYSLQLSYTPGQTLVGLGDILGRMYTTMSIGSRLNAKAAEWQTYLFHDVVSYLDARHFRHAVTLLGLNEDEISFAMSFNSTDQQDGSIQDATLDVLGDGGTSLCDEDDSLETSKNQQKADSELMQKALNRLLASGISLSAMGEFINDFHYRVAEDDVSWVQVAPSVRGTRPGFQMRFLRIPGYSFEEEPCPWLFEPYPKALRLPDGLKVRLVYPKPQW